MTACDLTLTSGATCGVAALGRCGNASCARPYCDSHWAYRQTSTIEISTVRICKECAAQQHAEWEARAAYSREVTAEGKDLPGLVARLTAASVPMDLMREYRTVQPTSRFRKERIEQFRVRGWRTGVVTTHEAGEGSWTEFEWVLDHRTATWVWIESRSRDDLPLVRRPVGTPDAQQVGEWARRVAR